MELLGPSHHGGRDMNPIQNQLDVRIRPSERGAKHAWRTVMEAQRVPGMRHPAKTRFERGLGLGFGGARVADRENDVATARPGDQASDLDGRQKLRGERQDFQGSLTRGPELVELIKREGANQTWRMRAAG